MYVGKAAPNFSLKDREGKEVTLQSLQGKPICIAFCFNLKQHELIFKPLEEAYKGRLTFVYLNVTPSTSFELWQSLTENRPNVVHLWGSDEDAKKLKETYATTMGFPFVVIDAQGKIVERWIPQEFPDNKTLQKELSGLVKK
jgi:peroxiredoxin